MMLKTAGSDSSPHRMTSTMHNTAMSIRLLHLALDSAALSSAAEMLKDEMPFCKGFTSILTGLSMFLPS